MAKQKKSRTPAPPRRPPAPRSDGAPRQVQAPQVRTKKRTQEQADRRNRLILYALGASGILGVAIALLALFVIGRDGAAKAYFDGPAVDFANVPALIKTPPPWKANSADLPARLKVMGLPPLANQEGTLLHIHQHLDIFSNGKRVQVPTGVGIRVRGNQRQFAEIHTHDDGGVIHTESFRQQTVSLGQLFGVWGVNFAKNCVGGLCAPPGPFKIYVNGGLIQGDPVKLVLQEHQEIAIVYGTPPDDIPSSYDWPAGL